MILSPAGTMLKPPCQKCDTRKVGCHDSCPSYQEYKAKAVEVNEAVRVQRYKEGGLIMYACTEKS